ncbi:MAG: CoA transferase, partial [Rhodococcus sp. (in: high G+C Gram-positive bacteria)]
AHPSLFPYEPLPTADNDLIITAGNDAQFRKLVGVLGVPELADDPRFAKNEDRTERREELRPLLVERLRTESATHWFDKLNEVGVPNGPINTIAQGVQYAEKLGLEPVVQVGTPGATVPGVRNPITFSGFAPRYDLAPPTLGQDSDEVRAWLSAATTTAPPTTGQGQR